MNSQVNKLQLIFLKRVWMERTSYSTNVEGIITKVQHRLHAIVDVGVIVPMVVVLGVELDKMLY